MNNHKKLDWIKLGTDFITEISGKVYGRVFQNYNNRYECELINESGEIVNFMFHEFYKIECESSNSMMYSIESLFSEPDKYFDAIMSDLYGEDDLFYVDMILRNVHFKFRVIRRHFDGNEGTKEDKQIEKLLNLVYEMIESKEYY